MADEGINEVLAQEVQRVFASRQWKSFQQAEIATGLPASTIQRLHRGASVKADTAVKFGEAIGESKEKWVRVAAGLSPEPQPRSTDPLLAVAEDIDTTEIESALNDVADTSAGIERFTDASDRGGERFIGGPLRGMRVRGGCMEPMLYDGEVILVAPPHSVVDGDVVIATVDFVNVTCKVICIPEDGGPSYLEPFNGEGKITEDRFVVSGVVMRVLDDPKHRLARWRKEK